MLFAIKWADIVYLLPMQRPLSGKLKGAGLVHYSYLILKTKVFNFSQKPDLRKIVHYEAWKSSAVGDTARVTFSLARSVLVLNRFATSLISACNLKKDDNLF